MDGQGRDDDLTRPISGRPEDPDPTQRIETPAAGYAASHEQATGEATDRPGEPGDAEPEPDPDATSDRARTIAIGAVGALIGFVIAFIVIALGTSGDTDDAQIAAAQEEVAELEATIDEQEATIADLEARLAEAEAAAGARDQDAEAQREALDERASILDERETALQERSDALDQREQELRQREQDDDGGGPTFDEEAAENFMDRIVDQIRDLFQGD